MNEPSEKPLEPQNPYDKGTCNRYITLEPSWIQEFYTNLCTTFPSLLWGGTSKHTMTISSHIVIIITVTAKYHLQLIKYWLINWESEISAFMQIFPTLIHVQVPELRDQHSHLMKKQANLHKLTLISARSGILE